MKKLSLILATFFLWSCSGSQKGEDFSSNKPINNIADTINRTDANGLKQGPWIITDWKATEVKHKQILTDSGNYVNNKRQGTWHFYDSLGNLSHVVEFENDFPLKR